MGHARQPQRYARLSECSQTYRKVFDVKSSNDEHTITYLETQQGDLTLAIYSYILLGLNTTSVASTGWKGTGSVSKAVLFMLDRLKKSVCPRKGLSDNQNCFI